MKIGEKFVKGYKLLEAKEWEGIFYLYEAVTNLYEIDAVDQVIYDSLTNYVRNVDMTGDDTEENQWIKVLLLDSRYAGLLLKPGELLDNLSDVLNKFPEVPDDIINDMFMDGGIPELKYADDRFFYIQKDFMKKNSFLVMKYMKDGEMINRPIDFDVDDFHINRHDKRIEYAYGRGFKGTNSVDYNGEDKKTIS